MIFDFMIFGLDSFFFVGLYYKSQKQLTTTDLNRNINPDTVKTMQVKLANCQVLQTVAPLHNNVKQVSSSDRTLDIIDYKYTR
ncbi:MAG: hypothetical protein A2W77_07935 [Nitrospinae bacterium RIFCSPLOWO2_12_39_16]|nr:MAG: hypothetical protein A2W77_07935 [Nitrospinae bacterium RIFCSPLOWO2_12_39_16]